MSRVAINADEVIDRVRREGVDAILSRGEAAALIATFIARPHAATRDDKNRVAMRMDRNRNAVADYVHGTIFRLADGRYTAGDVLRWAREVYKPKPFTDLPPTPRTIYELVQVRAKASGEATMLVLPSDIEGCHERIKHLERENAELRKAISESEANRRRELASRFPNHPLNTSRRRLGK